MRRASRSGVSPARTVTVRSRKGFAVLHLGNAHATERVERVAERAIDRLGTVFGGENDAIDFAAEPNDVQPECPMVAGRGGGRRRESR